MIVTLSIPDWLYQIYAEFNVKNPRQALQKQLERFKDIPSSERVVLLHGDARKAIEAAYGRAIEDPARFAAWIQELVALKIGDEPIPLRDGARQRLMTEAKFYKKEPGDYIRERTKQALDQAWGAY